MFLQRDYIECPFCKKEVIELLIKPSVLSAKRTACRAGRSTSWHRSKEEVIVLTSKCPSCGKSREEIEKKLREEGFL
jgi:hypothetical protein